MKKIIIILVIVCIAAGIWGVNFYREHLRGIAPAFGPIPTISKSISQDVSPTDSVPLNTTGLPLTLPEGVTISTYAKNIPNARVMVWDPNGKMLVSSPATGKVFRVLENGIAEVVIEGLNKPHGLAFKDGNLYIAETDTVAEYDYNGKASLRRKLFELPGGGNHFSRTIGFGPDGKLYVSVGSSCNVCREADSRRASILVYDGELKTFATGLRNSVFFTWYNGQMWATDMGRDLLGDNTPPEEVNLIKEGRNYGWPYCYGNRIPDRTFGGSESLCSATEAPVIEYQAHSAPLGLAFDKNYLYVAMHGSWNRSTPTGYKVVRFDLNDKYKPSDFITGWLHTDGALGRPVDLLFDTNNTLYISDDKAGVIYKVTI